MLGYNQTSKICVLGTFKSNCVDYGIFVVKHDSFCFSVCVVKSREWEWGITLWPGFSERYDSEVGIEHLFGYLQGIGTVVDWLPDNTERVYLE